MRIGLLLMLSLLGLTGCEKEPPSPTSSGKVVMTLFDLSQSTQNPAMRQKYHDSFQRILAKVGGGDILVADLITDDPLSQSSFPINEPFEAFNPGTDNPMLVKKKQEEFDEQLKARRGQLVTKAQTLLNDQTRHINKTRILDAMRLAERVFKTYQQPKKVLVIFSDMIEDSDLRNFQKQPPTDAETTQLLEREKKAVRCLISRA